MSKKSYTDEYRADAVKMVVRDRQPVSKVAKSLGMSAPTLHCWVKQSRTGTGVFTPKECLEEKAHMREIEAENRRLKIENEI